MTPEDLFGTPGVARGRAAPVERLFDPLMWCWCAAAWGLVMAIPVQRRRNLLDRLAFWLLPFAGFYAYHQPEHGSTWRWSERCR